MPWDGYKLSIISTEDTAIIELFTSYSEIYLAPNIRCLEHKAGQYLQVSNEVQCSPVVHVCGAVGSLHVLGGCSTATVLLQVQIENSCRYSFRHSTFQQMSLKHGWKNPITGNTRCQYVFFTSLSQQQMELTLSMQRLSVCTVNIHTGIWGQLLHCKGVFLSSISCDWITNGPSPSKLSFIFIKARGALCHFKCPNQLCCCLNKEGQLNPC